MNLNGFAFSHKSIVILAWTVSVALGLAPGSAGFALAAAGTTVPNGKPLQTADYVTVAKVDRSSAPVRKEARSSSKQVATLKRGEEFPIVRTAKYHYQIRMLGGKTGWIRKSYVDVRQAPRYIVGWQFGGGTEGLKWSAGNRPRLDVVSPKWYGIDAERVLTGSPDRAYVDWAHANGKKVWAMIGNGFDAELTDQLLSSDAKRGQLVGKLAASLVANGVDGINVDFENIDIKNKRDFVDFVRELRAAVSKKGIVVSVDVTRENEDPFWSGSYDRAALGRAADYVVMMGYEEYYGTRGEAGSVASMPWVEDGLRKLLAVVPAHKVILAVPFYTREWVEPKGGGKAVPKDLTMHALQKLIGEKKLQKRWDKAAGQFYVEYADDAGRHRIWVEDATSMKTRWRMVGDYSLGGAAAWALGQETSDIWTVFQ